MSRPRPPYRDLGRDEGGSVLTVWAIALGAFLGLVALSYDFGRMATTQSDLQAYADSIALVAAGELDTHDDAIDRARAAAANLIRDQHTFGAGDRTLTGANDFILTFYAERPDDAGSVPATTDPNEAGFVRVEVPNQTVTPILGAAFAALTGQTTGNEEVGATAVAGITNYACGITPLMVCTPSTTWRAEDHIGQSIQLRAGGEGAGWGPGAFGWVDIASGIVDIDGACAGLTGNKLDICLIASTGNRTACMAQNGIDVRPGQRVGNFEASINVLFDIYSASASGLRNDPDYAPAAVVRSSLAPNNGQCIGSAPIPSLTTMGFPPDDCQVDGSCGRYGDGNWSEGRAEYVRRNFGLIDPFPTAVTRYDYYSAEVAAAASLSSPGAGAGGSVGGLSAFEQAIVNGMPQCSPHAAADERRTMIVAGVDCGTYEVKAGNTNIPVQQFFEIFLISPIGQDGTFDFWVEVLGPVSGGSGGRQEESMFREVVVLYD